MTRDTQYPWYDDKPPASEPRDLDDWPKPQTWSHGTRALDVRHTPATGGRIVAFGDHMGVDDLDGSGWDYVSYSDIDYDDTGIDRVQLVLAKIRTWGGAPTDTPDASDFTPATDLTETSIAALSIRDDTPRPDRAAMHGKQNS